MGTAESIRDEFLKRRELYKAFATCVSQLLTTLLTETGIRVHSISARVKDPHSLYVKANRPGRIYTSLTEVTDLAGLRIITYLPDDVDKVSLVVNKEFAIDEVNSVDKRLTNDPDRFGYGSVHKVCSLNDYRVRLGEYAKFDGLKCEVQIRTILQHAWAEIEHDLGYKSAIGAPVPLKRRFSRVAALLESADEEFMRLKNELSEYSHKIREGVEKARPGIPLDRITLKLFIETNGLIEKIEKTIHWSNDAKLVEIAPSTLDQYVQGLTLLGVTHIDSLANALERLHGHMAKAVTRCNAVDYGSEVCRTPAEKGWPVWTLIQLLCAERPTREETIEAMKGIELWIADSLENYADSLREIVRDTDPLQTETKVKDYKSVYVTLVTEEGGRSFPLELKGDKWVWENVTLTDEHVVIDETEYPIQSKTPLCADIVHKHKHYVITW